MNILIATDAFPPVCGGSGWSTFELARTLRSHGHDVLIVRPMPGAAAGVRETAYEGIPVREFGFRAPNIPYVRNYFKSEYLARVLGEYLWELLRARTFDLVHAQHVMTALPSIHAAKRTGTPVVMTVRDYWPVCYWSDLIRTRDGLELCPACTTANMTVCIRPRAGGAWPLALPMIPYMRANLSEKRGSLARADAVIAVSRQMAADLSVRAPELKNTRIEVIPNPVNVANVRALSGTPPMEGPYGLYLGKLARNKGTDHLFDVLDLQRAGLAAGYCRRRASARRDGERRRQPSRPISRLARSGRIGALAGARLPADFSLSRARVVEPRPDRSQRPGNPDRSNGHRRHPGHHRPWGHGVVVVNTRSARRRRPSIERRWRAPATAG